MSEINFKINQRAALLKWADDTEKYLINSIGNKDLTDSYELKNSVKKQTIGMLTDVKTFIFSYNLYGMYVDMGLFGGKGLDDKRDSQIVSKLTGKRKKNKMLKNHPKRKYQWYSRSMYGSINVLGNLMMEQYGNKAINAFKLPEIIEI
jgi:hypothetical protein